MIRINNTLDLYTLEKSIQTRMQEHDLDDLLSAFRTVAKEEKIRPFMIAGAALFALRFARPPVHLKKQIDPVAVDDLMSILGLVNTYLLTDPVGFDPPAFDEYHGSTLLPVMLRTVASQFPYEDNFWGQYGRSLKLFRDIPERLKTSANNTTFNFESRFLELNGVSLTQFIDIGFILYSAALSNTGFVGDYFDKARAQGISLPPDSSIGAIIEQFAADLIEMRATYERYKQPDRRYAAYDFNPLWVYPLVRPWTTGATPNWTDYRLMAPLPQLVLSRMSGGIYSQLFHHFKGDFANYFGVLFENYVGDLLRESFPAANLLSESDLRKKYQSDRGKVPDWVVFEGKTATLIECKATGLSAKALATADSAAIDYGVDQIVRGLIQLHEFKESCLKKLDGLEILHSCTRLNLILVTYEPFYLINSEPFRNIINAKLELVLKSQNIALTDWQVLSIGELEKLQPHLAASIGLGNVFRDLKSSKDFNSVLERCHAQTGKTYRDSFLYETDMEIYQRLKVPHE